MQANFGNVLRNYSTDQTIYTTNLIMNNSRKLKVVIPRITLIRQQVQLLPASPLSVFILQ